MNSKEFEKLDKEGRPYIRKCNRCNETIKGLGICQKCGNPEYRIEFVKQKRLLP